VGSNDGSHWGLFILALELDAVVLSSPFRFSFLLQSFAIFSHLYTSAEEGSHAVTMVAQAAFRESP